MDFDLVGSVFKFKLKLTIGIIITIILLILCAYYSLSGENGEGEIDFEGETFITGGSGTLQVPLAGDPPITSYIYRKDGFTYHGGIDYGVKVGTPVYAAADGVVVFTANWQDSYGTHVVIQHDNGLRTWYGHGTPNSQQVKEGDRVLRGQLIMLSGNTGRSTGPHLHFEVRVKPYKYINVKVNGKYRKGERRL